MDTRIKIVSFDEALRIAREKPVRWVTGHFDPLLPEHTRRVWEFALADHLLVVLVTEPTSPLLPLRARAELVAALAQVDYVVEKHGPTPAREPEDEQITRDFIERVIRRNRGEEL